MDKISMAKIIEILRQKFELQRSNREIANSLNISSSTVSEYVNRAKVAGFTWPIKPLTEEELYAKLFLPPASRSKNKTQPDWSYIYHELRKKGLTLMLLWREYRDQCVDGLCYSGFCHGYQQYVRDLHPVMRQVYKAGEKAMVDYSGMKLSWINTADQAIGVEIFVGCLAASQLIFAEATASQKLADWISSHINMFDFFGGVTEIIVPDNLKSGVSKAHLYDPDLNAGYQHFAEYYGVAVVPARVRAPKDKAKVENAVGIVERQILAPLRNTRFLSLGQINAAIKPLLDKVNNQQLQKLPLSRQELFEKVDKAALKPLPVCKYEYANWLKAKVGTDYHVAHANNYYSVPYKLIGKLVDLRISNKLIEIFYNRERIAIHQISSQPFGCTSVKEHMPLSHQAQTDTNIENILARANKIGIDTAQFVKHMLSCRKFPQQALRPCLGLIRLVTRYGAQRLNQACKKSLLVGATRYQEVEAMLRNNLETIITEPKTNASTTAEHENIRGAQSYQ